MKRPKKRISDRTTFIVVVWAALAIGVGLIYPLAVLGNRILLLRRKE